MPFYPSGDYGRIVRETRADGSKSYIFKDTD
jgi:hypothetical protein